MTRNCTMANIALRAAALHGAATRLPLSQVVKVRQSNSIATTDAIQDGTHFGSAPPVWRILWIKGKT